MIGGDGCSSGADGAQRSLTVLHYSHEMGLEEKKEQRTS